MADEDKESKTEEPTSKKLQEAFDKGNVAFSKEVGSFMMLLLLAIVVASYAPDILRDSRDLLMKLITDPDEIAVDRKGISILLSELAFGSIAILMMPLLGSVVVAIASSVLQNGLMISGESIKPKFSKISPMAGFGRIFSMRTVVEFIKNITKITIVSVVAYNVIYPQLANIKNLPSKSVEDLLIFLALLTTKLMVGIVIAMFFIALFDLVYQRLKHTKELRMTKQEIKDEYKQSEGDPMIKGKLRQLRQEKAKQRMMAEVPKSDVIITNPTHFAIALTYSIGGKSKAPVVVAKGKDLIALRIREIAELNNIPIVQNPPLARALFDSTDIDQEIPLAHYEAVAKIISYVYSLKGKRL